MSVAAKGIFIVGAKRTPFGRFGGLLRNTSSVDMMVAAGNESLKEANLSPNMIDTVNIGNNFSVSGHDGASGLVPRHAALKLGIPKETPALGINRACGSGFQAVINGAQEIMLGTSKISLTGGTENMSNMPFLVYNIRFGIPLGSIINFEDSLILGSRDTYSNLAMAETAENLAQKYDLSREEVDEYAFQSQSKWREATTAGAFKYEISPISVKVKNKTILMEVDEHPRPETTIEGLTQLPTLFKKNGVVTAGNASGINDGAAAIVLASEQAVKENNLKPLARLVGWSYVGCEPSIMGIGPVPAINNLLKVTNLKLDDIDLIEINEAFAAQTLACQKELKLDPSKLNINGGAIAVGHPIAASGARITAHLIHQLRRCGLKRGIGSACIGGGQGIAVLLESV